MLPGTDGNPWPGFPGGNGEVADLRFSFESTRRGRRPANSFMSSVTAPGSSRLVYWTTSHEHHVNTPVEGRPSRARCDGPRSHDQEEESRSWTSFAPPAGRRRSPRRPSTPQPSPSPVAPM
ncbi:hypothetical protein EAO77_16325 [Streptomyces sp. t39]|nr:hypothetical protein EAO77_16325 [Streptomyces sp. t39]